VVELSLAAWAPVFESFRSVLGEQLYHLAFPDWRERQRRTVRSLCSSEEAEVWVATVDGEPVGFVASRLDLASDPLVGEIEMIAVHPGHQRSGIATGLLEHAIGQLHEAGVAWSPWAGQLADGLARRCYPIKPSNEGPRRSTSTS
jgi:ribosomal protein S18 acetylase RimI-like enzyme